MILNYEIVRQLWKKKRSLEAVKLGDMVEQTGLCLRTLQGILTGSVKRHGARDATVQLLADYFEVPIETIAPLNFQYLRHTGSYLIRQNQAEKH